LKQLGGGRIQTFPSDWYTPGGHSLRDLVRLVSTDAEHRVWQQYDLRTGEAGKTCEGESLWTYYIASDGDVVVALDEGDGLIHGVDLTTCDVLWSVPGSAPNEAKEVWKVHTTLIQRTDDKIFSLVAPR
jgi:hypothetical protein